MGNFKFKLPGTVGPWFTYWIEYIPESELGSELKKWFRSAISQVLAGNPFSRRALSSITRADLNELLKSVVQEKFNKEESALLKAYFESAMVAAKNLGGAESFKVGASLFSGESKRRKVFLLILGSMSALTLFFGVQAVDRIVNKKEDVLTAGATVLRENGLGIVVAFFEDVYYNYINPAKVGGAPTVGPNDDDTGEVSKFADLLEAKVAFNADWGPARQASEIPPSLISPAVPIDGEGEWKPTKIIVNDNTAIWIARIRPDNVHTSFWATVTWFDPQLLAFAQVPGTKVPEVSGLSNRTGQVPSNLKPFYVAGLNGGFLMRDSQGGYEFEGTEYKELRNGKASLVTYKDGSLDVVEWGRDPVKANVQAVRQNMELIVDGGVSQVEDENQNKWGWVWQGVSSGKNLVWRSAVGVRADGTVVSVLGCAMSATSLADVLVRAGAVRAILLDMNASYANGYLYGPYKDGKPLDPAISIGSRRFLDVSERDFLAVYVKSPASGIN